MAASAKSLGSRGLFGLMIFFAVGIAIYAFAFQFRATGSPELFARFDNQPIFGPMHILGAGVALLLGGFQFSSRLRQGAIGTHRWLGRIYLLAVVIGGIGGFAVALEAGGGLVARFGFASLAVIWLYSAWQAYAAIRRGDIVCHRAWMIRNFALTFAAVTLRLHLGLFQVAGVPFAQAYPVVAWLAWVPNLIIAEWWFLNLPKRASLPHPD